jgi:hypothetical protein
MQDNLFELGIQQISASLWYGEAPDELRSGFIYFVYIESYFLLCA